jgi:Protein of unknown function (DUF1778)
MQRYKFSKFTSDIGNQRIGFGQGACHLTVMRRLLFYRSSSMTSATASSRSVRLGLRATPEQETLLRRAAEVAQKSLTDFILDAAYQAAEQTLLDQRLFMVSEPISSPSGHAGSSGV